jgi:AcrR family transcriptional regulator
MLIHACQERNRGPIKIRMKGRERARSNQKLAVTERRRQIAAIAMDFIATKGFEGLRYQQVAKAAGINTGTLFYYFSNKEELIQEVMQHLKEEFSRTPGRPVDKPTTALEELRLEFESISNLMQKQPKLFLVHAEISLRALRDPIIEREVRNLDSLWKQHLIQVIEQGKAEDIFRSDISSESTAVTLISQFKGIGWHAMTGGLKRKEIRETVTQIARQTEYWLTGKGA